MVILIGIGAHMMATGCATRPERDPDRSLTLLEVAVTSFSANRLEAAIKETQDALKADPENADAHNLLGIIALRHGAEDLAQIQDLDCLSGEDAALVQADAVKNFRQAQEYFEKALELNPDLATAWNNLSVVALQLQDWKLAETAATRALSSGTYAQPYMAQGNRGWAYYHDKNLQKAWKDLHDAVSRQPEFCVGRYRLAKVYRDRGQIDDAAEQIDAILADKRCPIQEAYLLGAMVEHKRSNIDKALDLLERCVPMAPRSCVARECRRYAELVN